MGIREVAKMASVSSPTVSRLITDPGKGLQASGRKIPEDGAVTAFPLTRRAFVGLSLGSAVLAAVPELRAQGVAAHAVKPMARPVPSGRPFSAHFVDVARSAGLHAPVVYGGVESKKYILEACCSSFSGKKRTLSMGS